MHSIHLLPFKEASALVADHARAAPPLVGDLQVISIDGRAGAGKSTMAEHLSTVLDGAPIVHMDDLYRGWEDALTPRLSATLRDQILVPMSLGKAGSYRAWDWHRAMPGEARSILRHPFLILEGVGASQRVVRPFTGTMVWIDIDPARGLERVLQRDSQIVSDVEEFTRRMQSWQGEELLHFERENTFDAAHLRFDGGLFW